MRKKQNGGWKLSDTDWFYFSFYNPSCFFLWSELIRVQFYFIFIFFIRSELVRVDPSWSDPEWRSELIRSDFCTCLLRMTTFHLVGLPIWTWSSKDVWFLSWKNFAKCGWKLKASWTWLHWCHSGNLKKPFMKDDIASQRNSFGWLYFSWVLQN